MSGRRHHPFGLTDDVRTGSCVKRIAAEAFGGELPSLVPTPSAFEALETRIQYDDTIAYCWDVLGQPSSSIG